MEFQACKICTTQSQASGSEPKTVKTPSARNAFGSLKRVPRGKRRDFDMLQNACQAQRFVKLKNISRRHGGIEEGPQGSFCAGAGVSRSRKRIFEVSGTQLMEGCCCVLVNANFQGSLMARQFRSFLPRFVWSCRQAAFCWLSGIFEGSLVERWCLAAFNWHFWRKSSYVLVTSQPLNQLIKELLVCSFVREFLRRSLIA